MAQREEQMIELSEVDLRAVYNEMRELSEGRGSHKAAAEHGITYLFEVLGEPGAGE